MDASPKLADPIPLYVTPNAWAASYITFSPYLCPIFAIASTSHIKPYTCVATIAAVFSVMAASIYSGFIVQSDSLISTKTGFNPLRTMA